jgi:hypothetical protein
VDAPHIIGSSLFTSLVTLAITMHLSIAHCLLGPKTSDQQLVDQDLSIGSPFVHEIINAHHGLPHTIILRDFAYNSTGEEKTSCDFSSGYSTSISKDAPNLHASPLHYLNNFTSSSSSFFSQNSYSKY